MIDDATHCPPRFEEDVKFLCGTARFVDDIQHTHLAHALFLRASRAHARILKIDTDAAGALPGVLAIFTGADIEAEKLGGIPWEVRPPGRVFESVPLGSPDATASQPLIASERIVYCGEIVAMVVSTDLHRARQALDMIEVTYDDLPVQISLTRQVVDIWPGFIGNECFRFEMGDAAAVTTALGSAHAVVSLTCHNQRISAAPLEPRAYIGSYFAADDRMHLQASAGKPHFARNTMAHAVFHVPRERISVETPDVGGGFGAKNILYPEECLVVWAAKKLGKSVKWVASRSESLSVDLPGRDQLCFGEMAFDKAGRILGYRARLTSNLGAYLAPRGVVPVRHSANALSSVYNIPALHVEATGVFTNTTPTCSLRGTGAPEMAFLTERLMDLAAARLGLDRMSIRTTNMLGAADMPYMTAHGIRYDSGDPLACALEAQALAKLTTFAERRRASEQGGRLRGIGIANGIEILNVFYDETSWLELREDGSLLCRMGTQSSGQGHASVIADLISRKLCCPRERVIVLQGDTRIVPFGNGTGASRSTSAGGSAAYLAAGSFIDAAASLISRVNHIGVDEVEFYDGMWRIHNLSYDLDAIHALAMENDALTELSVCGTFQPRDGTYPYGCSICEVEIDPETGALAILKYVSVHDVGCAISPPLIEGQVHGSTLQGLGQAMCEQIIFDASGQMITGSFMDYALPIASMSPEEFVTAHIEIPSPGNPLGAKGVGESGTTTAPPALINAIIDALGPLGVTDIAMPATPMAIWKAIQNGTTAKEEENS